MACALAKQGSSRPARTFYQGNQRTPRWIERRSVVYLTRIMPVPSGVGRHLDAWQRSAQGRWDAPDAMAFQFPPVAGSVRCCGGEGPVGLAQPIEHQQWARRYAHLAARRRCSVPGRARRVYPVNY